MLLKKKNKVRKAIKLVNSFFWKAFCRFSFLMMILFLLTFFSLFSFSILRFQQLGKCVSVSVSKCVCVCVCVCVNVIAQTEHLYWGLQISFLFFIFLFFLLSYCWWRWLYGKQKNGKKRTNFIQKFWVNSKIKVYTLVKTIIHIKNKAAEQENQQL